MLICLSFSVRVLQYDVGFYIFSIPLGYLIVIESQNFCYLSEMSRHAAITSVAGLISNLCTHGIYTILFSIDLLLALLML